MTDSELTTALLRCASMWFKNTDYLFLEELLRRWNRAEMELKRLKTEPAHATDENVPK